ncbi:hypothetical protein ACFL54_09870, partial [Planctomycetota bacterium]
EQIQSALAEERAALKAEGDKAKTLVEENIKLSAGFDKMKEKQTKISEEAVKAARELEERLSQVEKRNTGLTEEIGRISGKADAATREMRAANAARELAEDRERALSEQRKKDEARIRALSKRVNELVAQRGALQAEMEVTRSAMDRVATNIDALTDMQNRKLMNS